MAAVRAPRRRGPRRLDGRSHDGHHRQPGPTAAAAGSDVAADAAAQPPSQRGRGTAQQLATLCLVVLGCCWCWAGLVQPAGAAKGIGTWHALHTHFCHLYRCIHAWYPICCGDIVRSREADCLGPIPRAEIGYRVLGDRCPYIMYGITCVLYSILDLCCCGREVHFFGDEIGFLARDQC